MLQIIKIRNFQALKDVTITLGNVTVLVGKSDVGKSAFIRALNSFFHNSFNEEYAHNGNLPCGIAIQKDGKVAIGRRTTKGVEYKLDSTVYSKTAKKLPTDISSFLGIQEYAIDKDYSILFQIQNQFDSPFLLQESSTSVAKIIGRISNLNVVLMAMRQMYADQLDTKQELNFANSKLNQAKESLKKFSSIKEQEVAIFKAKQLSKDLSSQESLLDSVRNTILSIELQDSELLQVVSEQKSINRILSEFPRFESQVKSQSDISKLVSEFSDLKEPVKLDIDLLESSFSQFSDFISTKAELELIATKYQDIEHASTNIKSESLLLSNILAIDIPDNTSLKNLVSEGNDYVTKATALRAEIASYTADNNAFLVEYEEFKNTKFICPFSKLEMQEYCKSNM